MAVVLVENVSKSYRLRGTSSSLRETLASLIRRPFSRAAGLAPVNFWALRDVSFTLAKGEALGIVGPNGAGKTTVLKLLSRITAPTRGRVAVRGKVASLIELGAGFHPELTGSENIYLNGAILGLTRRQINQRFDSIVEFAELQQFIHLPVKRYSSGMYVRLGFAVAVHADADLLLMDEVLSVGDARFQQRSLRKMRELQDRGTTIILVSHNLPTVALFCDRALFLSGGRIVDSGATNTVIGTYMKECRRLDAQAPALGSAASTDLISFENVRLLNHSLVEAHRFRYGEDLHVQIRYRCKEKLPGPCFTLTIRGAEGRIFQASMLLDGTGPPSLEGTGVLDCSFRRLPLAFGSYHIVGSVKGKDGITYLMQPQLIAMFSVEDDLTAYGWKDRAAAFLPEVAPVVIPYEWRFSKNNRGER